jgi:mannosyltransferase OCH1-like enzyme
MIPKLIHQTVPDKTASADEFLENIENIKALNPGYTHVLYDNEDQRAIIREKWGSAVYSFYERINPIYGVARTDFFKYLLMYWQGGVYLDIKSTATRALDEVLTSSE